MNKLIYATVETKEEKRPNLTEAERITMQLRRVRNSVGRRINAKRVGIGHAVAQALQYGNVNLAHSAIESGWAEISELEQLEAKLDNAVRAFEVE